MRRRSGSAIDPYTGDFDADRLYEGIPVANHRRLAGGKRRRSKSVLRNRRPLRVRPLVGTLVLSTASGDRFAVVRTFVYRYTGDKVWTPRAKPITPPVTLVNRHRGHSAKPITTGDVSYDERHSPKSDASGYVPTGAMPGAGDSVEWTR